ncbi:MAG: glycosyl hydrolase family 17 protein [Cyclobacteriaceae bacterium]
MTEIKKVNAQMILGNPNYRAISYGGYRTTTREVQPTVGQLMDDIKILSAMGIKVLRTYNVQLPHASNVLKAISQLKQADPSFEMYVMLGAWIDCKNAWTDREPDHFQESEQNTAEIDRVVALAKQYPDIVKIIAVGNEAMVKWAASYFVQPGVILKWVNHIQSLKVAGELPSDLWVTSSDNFASWGGGGGEYHVGDLTKLIEAVDFISLHTYPMHDTHYNPVFWGVTKDEEELSKEEQLEKVMQRSVEYAKMQYYNVKKYIDSLGIKRPLHVGETGWASLDADDHHYGKNGSRACDEYKEALYYRMMREWTDAEGISCFFFEAFDEPWKDAMNDKGSENHFGLFTVDGKAKYAIWEMVDKGVFDGLKREGNAIQKTFGGDALLVLEQSPLPQLLSVN